MKAVKRQEKKPSQLSVSKPKSSTSRSSAPKSSSKKKQNAVENEAVLSAPPSYMGHRERVRKKILSLGSESMADYELLEALLMQAIPRKDTKPLAKLLISTFGSLGGVFEASPEALQRVPGIKETAASLILLVKACCVSLTRLELFERPIIGDSETLLQYCKINMGDKTQEVLRVFFLTNTYTLIKDEEVQRGTLTQAPLYPREIVKRALELGAASVILVHNHPSGNTSPSREDVLATQQLKEALNKISIQLHDHFIVSNTGHFSFKKMGLLKD